jgi:hypothetical protein
VELGTVTVTLPGSCGAEEKQPSKDLSIKHNFNAAKWFGAHLSESYRADMPYVVKCARPLTDQVVLKRQCAQKTEK